jgi:hypothetical protein
LDVVKAAHDTTVAAVPGAQCYGQLSRYLDEYHIPHDDRLVVSPASLSLWAPAARAWKVLHKSCDAIKTEVRVMSSVSFDTSRCNLTDLTNSVECY